MTEVDDQRADMRALLHRLWAAIVRYRGMVAAMFAFALLQAIFTKLPLILVKPLMGELAGEGRNLAAGAGWHPPLLAPEQQGWTDQLLDDFNTWFRGFANELMAMLGLSTGDSSMNVILACALVAAVCGVLGAFTIYFVQTISRFFAIRIVADLRCELADHFLHLPLLFYGRKRMGEMISKVTNDAQVLQRSFELASDNVVLDPLMILGNVGILAWAVPQAIWILVPMLPLMAIPMYRQGRKVRKRSRKSLEAMGEATESLNQILTGIRTVKAFQLEEQRMADYRASNETFLERTRRMLRAKGRTLAQTFVGYQIGFAALLALFGYLSVSDGGIELSSIAVALVPLSTTYQHVKRLTRSYNVLMESSGALRGIEDILREGVDPTQHGGRALDRVRGDVTVEGVRFGYGDIEVLRGVDFEVRAGETVALVGPSGAGKSTLFDILMRFHDPHEGRILVDGVDLREVRLSDFRRHTAVVSQQPFLFNASIRDNIAYGRPGAGDADIEAAARAAFIHDFIVSLPEGYDTLAGERGSRLSGGQMQRITIARAILRDPAILFLDEATSALDSESEEQVQQALERLRHGRTSFVIAHRLSTISDADRIVVLDEGRVVESGTHDELFACGGLYRRMCEMQAPAGTRTNGS